MVSDTESLIDKTWKYLSNDYEFVGEIGKGTFGVVIQARHIATNKDVAIKIIKNVFNNEDMYTAKKQLGEI